MKVHQPLNVYNVDRWPWASQRRVCNACPSRPLLRAFPWSALTLGGQEGFTINLIRAEMDGFVSPLWPSPQVALSSDPDLFQKMIVFDFFLKPSKWQREI